MLQSIQRCTIKHTTCSIPTAVGTLLGGGVGLFTPWFLLACSSCDIPQSYTFYYGTMISGGVVGALALGSVARVMEKVSSLVSPKFFSKTEVRSAVEERQPLLVNSEV